jgi:cytochrome c oxidase assembly protein subunit 15
MAETDGRDFVVARQGSFSDPITRWLLLVGALVIIMVLIGGFVRLSRAGLSIVEWDVVTGVVPPIGDAAWEQSFTDYQQTPEYQLVNSGMSLGDYQRIFYLEWTHRLIARIAGLLVVIPLLWFLWKGVLTWRVSYRYWAITAVFVVQGAIGWAMVSSGLRDRPVVSHLRLTIHLLTALVLLGIVLWMALDRLAPDGNDRPEVRSDDGVGARGTRLLAWAVLVTVVAQIAYGGLVAGLKAGHVSDTWPLMFGQFVPSGLLSVHDPWWMNLFEPLGSHFVHRWFAFVVAGLSITLFMAVRRGPSKPRMFRTTSWLIGVVALQITLGVGVVILGVPTWLALAHQGIGVAAFCIALVIVHQARTSPMPARDTTLLESRLT